MSNARTHEQIREIVIEKGYKLLKICPPENKHRKIFVEDSIGYKYELLLTEFLQL